MYGRELLNACVTEGALINYLKGKKKGMVDLSSKEVFVDIHFNELEEETETKRGCQSSATLDLYLGIQFLPTVYCLYILFIVLRSTLFHLLSSTIHF